LASKVTICEAMTEYEVIAEPPLLDGAVHETTADDSPDVPARSVGTPGTVAGTTAPEAVDAELVPALFVAVTVKV